MSEDRVEITWDDLSEEAPAAAPPPPPPPPPAPPPATSFGPPPSAVPPVSPPPGVGPGGLPGLPPSAPFTYAAPARSGGNRVPLIIGGVIAAVVVVAVLLNLAGSDDAGTLAPGGTASGSVGFDEADRFTIRGQGSSVSIRVFGADGFDPTVAVEDGGGSQIAYDDDGGESLDAALDVYLDDGSTYTVVVEGFSGGAGDYRVSVD